MVLYCSAQPLPVLSAGLSVAPDRIDPVWKSTRTRWRHGVWSGSLFAPALVQLPFAGGAVSRSFATSTWSIWPTFSARVIRLSRSFTRAGIGAFASRYFGGPAPGADAVTPTVAIASAVSSQTVAKTVRLIVPPLSSGQTLRPIAAQHIACARSLRSRPSRGRRRGVARRPLPAVAAESRSRRPLRRGARRRRGRTPQRTRARWGTRHRRGRFAPEPRRRQRRRRRRRRSA